MRARTTADVTDALFAALLDQLRRGDRLALARLLTQVENDTPRGRDALSALFSQTGRAHLVGVTGSPGAGKSSLVSQLVRHFRRPPDGAAPRKVAVVAVDPSSPFSGGAVLGDRVRMRDLAGDPGVFIRSMASRGALGGLARTTAAVAQILDAAGFDMILVETVGAGQADIEIVHLAHTVIVVEAPGMGDDIQAGKAGILEIADILAVNKADRPGAEAAERSLLNMLELARTLGKDASGWLPPVLRTVATEGQGITELAAEIDRHGAFLRRAGGWQRREHSRLQTEVESILSDELVARWRAALPEGVYQAALAEVLDRKVSPRYAVSRLLNTHFIR